MATPRMAIIPQVVQVIIAEFAEARGDGLPGKIIGQVIDIRHHQGGEFT